MRRILTFASIVATGALTILAIAPWLNACIGPLRFVDCSKFEKSTIPIALAPWYACAFEYCDSFPSTFSRGLRILVLVAVLATVAVFAARVGARRKMLLGFLAVSTTILIASALTRILYVGPGA